MLETHLAQKKCACEIMHTLIYTHTHKHNVSTIDTRKAILAPKYLQNEARAQTNRELYRRQKYHSGAKVFARKIPSKTNGKCHVRVYVFVCVFVLVRVRMRVYLCVCMYV